MTAECHDPALLAVSIPPCQEMQQITMLPLSDKTRNPKEPPPQKKVPILWKHYQHQSLCIVTSWNRKQLDAGMIHTYPLVTKRKDPTKTKPYKKASSKTQRHSIERQVEKT